jgi:hypothetical protein
VNKVNLRFEAVRATPLTSRNGSFKDILDLLKIFLPVLFFFGPMVHFRSFDDHDMCTEVRELSNLDAALYNLIPEQDSCVQFTTL